MNDHPTPEDLAGFVWNRVPSDRARTIVSHLVRGCEPCRAAVAPHLASLFSRAEPPEPVLLPAEDAEYEAAMDRAFATASCWAKDWKGESKRAALSLISETSMDKLPEVPSHLRGVPLFEALLERSWSLRHANPEEMVKAAEWARVLAERLEPSELKGETVPEDIQCRAWIELGNAHRVADDLPLAEIALGRATELYLTGTQDELLAARLFDVQASLLGGLRRFDLASTALDLVFTIYRRQGDDHLAGRALVKRGIYVGYQGQVEESVCLIEQGIGLIDENRDPRLMYIALHNHARFLMDCGRLRDARIALWKLKTRGLDAGGRINELKVRWLEGQINAALGELERAEAALLEVMLGFEEVDLPYKSALAGLELGLIMFRRGRTDAAIEEVLAAVQVFQALGIAREVSVSVLLLRKAIDRELLDIKLLEYVIDQLHRAEEARGGPFEPPAGE